MLDEYEQWLKDKIDYHTKASDDYIRLDDANAGLMHYNLSAAFTTALGKYRDIRNATVICNRCLKNPATRGKLCAHCHWLIYDASPNEQITNS